MKNNLAAIMGDRLVTITDVYKATGIARSTLVRLYYRRAKNISLQTLKTLCDYFGISLSELIEYIPKTKQPVQFGDVFKTKEKDVLPARPGKDD